MTDPLTETRRMVEQGRAERDAKWRAKEAETVPQAVKENET